MLDAAIICYSENEFEMRRRKENHALVATVCLSKDSPSCCQRLYQQVFHHLIQWTNFQLSLSILEDKNVVMEGGIVTYRKVRRVVTLEGKQVR